MRYCNHIENLSKVLVFSAPDHYDLIPKPLDDGFENVEILLDGEVFYPTAGGIQRFKRGTIFWHRSGEFDIWQNASAEHGYRCVCFTFTVNGAPASRVMPSIGVWKDIDNMDKFVCEARQLFANPNTDNDLLTAYVYGTLLRQFMAADELPHQQIPRKLYMAQLHINVTLPRAVAMDELARVVGCSSMHLNRLFTQYLNCTPAEYIMRRRMLHAANLLASSLAIKVIAEECSFKSLTGFYSAFRKYFNISPGKYRKECFSALKSRLEK